MFKLFSRIMIMMLTVMAIFVVAVMFWGKLFKRFPPLAIQTMYSGNSEVLEMAAYDIQSGIQFDYQQAVINLSPDGRMRVYFERIDGLTHLSLVNANGSNPRLIGVYDNFNTLSVITWLPDSQSIFMSYKPSQSDLELYQIDIETGEAILVGQYGFGRPSFMYMMNEQYLYLFRTNQFALMDIRTGEMQQYESRMFPRVSPDRRFLAYGTLAREFIGGLIVPDEMTVLHILDLETLDIMTLEAEAFGGSISGIMGWSTVGVILPIIQADNSIVFYNAETQIRETVLDDYQDYYRSSLSWSHNSNRIVLFNNQTQTLVILDRHSEGTVTKNENL